MALHRLLLFGDVHAPYHDTRAWALFLKVARWLRPRHLICLGDLADFYAVSQHDKDPGRAGRFAEELAACNRLLDQLDALRAKDKRFIEGNHCLSDDHRLLTPAGWRSRDDLSVGDLVAVLTDDGTVGWEAIERVVVRPLGDEALYQYESPSRVSLSVTARHNVLGRTNGAAWKRPAAECPDGFDLPVSAESGNPEYPLTDEALRVAAWACTDVHYVRQADRVVFYQSEGETLDLLRDDLAAYGVAFTDRARVRSVDVVAGKTLKRPARVGHELSLNASDGRRIRALTGLSAKGRLPAWVGQLSDRQWAVFLETLVMADGTFVRGAGALVFYGKRELCDDVQIAAVTHGWRASITEYRPGHFRVNLTHRDHIRVAGWKSAAVEAAPDTTVWCVTVPSGRLFTERRGCVHITGNCDRLRRHLMLHPELAGVVNTESLLRLRERGWRYTPYKRTDTIGKLHLTHDVGAAGRNAVFRCLDTYQHTIVTGHTHRLQYVVEGNALGEPKLSASFGWLGDVEQIDYMHLHRAKKDWALGFGVGTLDTATGFVYLTPVPIVEYTCCVDGRIFRA